MTLCGGAAPRRVVGWRIAALAVVGLLALGTEKAEARVLPVCPEPASKLWVLDLRGQGWQSQVTAACLQGIVNRKRPRLYTLVAANDGKWLDWLLERGYVKAREELPSLAHAIVRFRKEVRGAVVWDEALPETVNVASMEASLRQGIAMSAERAQREGLPVLLDLRGRWKSGREVLEWSLVHLKPKLRSGVMASIFPTAACQGVRDYAVAHRVFTFWADDAEGLERVAAAFRPNTALIGYWGHGSYGQPGYRGISEYAGLLILSQYGHFSSGSEFSTNWSVHSGVRVPRGAFRRKPVPAPELDPTKVYVAMHVVESGDALWYWQYRQRDVWEKTPPGAVPMGWSLNPTARDVLPAVLEWFYRRAPANQEFYGALSGLGYLSATDYGAKLPDAAVAWSKHTRALRGYLRDLSLRGLALWTGPWRVPDDVRTVLGRYASRLPEARYLLPDMGRAENVSAGSANYLLGDCVVMHCRTRWRVGEATDREGEIAWLVEEVRRNTPKSRPAFVSAMAYSWTHDPSTVEEVIRRLGPEYVAVTPSQLAALVRRASCPQPRTSGRGASGATSVP